MGQGRRIRSWLGWFLLVAGAIQGITPDARDLCSPSAMRVILAAQAVPVDFRGEDDPRDEMCLVDDQSAPLRDWQQQAVPRSASVAGPGVPLPDTTLVMATGLGPAGEIMPGFVLFEALCRLRC
jgi:hypothetical protein